jgi:hypothetical protein
MSRYGTNAETRKVTLRVLLCVFAFLVACIGRRDSSSPDVRPGPQLPPTQTQVTSGLSPNALGSYDDVHAAVADSVSGYAGLYFRGDTLVLMLVDTAGASAAEAAVRPLVEGHPYRRVEVRKALYDFRRLRDWKAVVRRNWSTAMNFVFIDPRRNLVVVGVRDVASLPRVRATLEAGGIPSNALAIEEITWMIKPT